MLKQAAGHAVRFANGLRLAVKRLDFRHRREGGAKGRKGPASRARSEDDRPAIVHGLAWA
jgi:hypothetical protein